MMVPPTSKPVARPVGFTVATFVADELHITNAVRSRVSPPGNVPIAVNCCVPPNDGMEALLGVTAIEVGPVTEMLAVPNTEPDCARMVEVPPPTPVASPIVGG